MKKRYLLLLPLIFTSMITSADENSTSTNGKAGFIGSYPQITQKTKIIENKRIDPKPNQYFIDEDKVDNLVKGGNYTVTSQVYNLTDNKIEDSFTKHTKFVAKNESEILNIKINGNAENLNGDTLVVYQTITDDGPQSVRKNEIVSISNDKNDKNEMVYVNSIGKGGINKIKNNTSATDTSGMNIKNISISFIISFIVFIGSLIRYKQLKKGRK